MLFRAFFAAIGLCGAIFGAAACTELKSGNELRSVISDTGLSDRDARPGLDAFELPDTHGDAGFADALFQRDADDFSDAEPQPDATEGDATEPGDAEVDDQGYDGGDTGVPECVPQQGSACSAPGLCGATYDCFGNCAGGAAPPPCNCSMPICQLDNTWTACNDPMNFGQSCDTTNSCGGTFDCSGACIGGAPLPSCQCGTPTCAGCMGGTCDVSSTCTNGQCTCVVNDCTVNGASYCVSNAIQQCTVDQYACGSLAVIELCTFGCQNNAPSCDCSPALGQYCAVELCFCQCGDFERPGEIQCDGSCASTSFCLPICRDACGPTGPED